MSLTRRQFGALLGGAALGATVPAWLRRAEAQSSEAPIRFLAVRTPHGADRDYWIPRQANGDEPPSTDQPLEELTFEYEDSVLGPLMNWRDRITVLDGIDTQVSKEGTRPGVRTFHGHNEQGVLLTGAQPPEDREGNYDGHPSLDFYLHSRLSAPVLITAAVEGSGTWKCMSYDDGGRPRSPETDPRAVFRAAFPSDFQPPDPQEPALDYTEGERLILAYDEAALRRLRERLQGAERVKLEGHLNALERLTPTGMPPMVATGACLTSGSDVPSRDGFAGSIQATEEVARAHAQVITQAFACGRSRVATLQILNDYPNQFSDLPDVRTPAILGLYGNDFRFHENLVHDYWGASGQTRIDLRRGYCAGLRWSATHFASVLEELDRVTDPFDPAGGTLLDNTIVFWHNEFGHDGHDNQHTRHPCVIAGGGGRTLRLGRYLRLRNIQSDERVPHNRLLVSLCHAMGFGDIDYFGDRDLVSRAEYQGPLVPLMA